MTTTSNPLLTDSLGRFSFFVADGLYDIIVTADAASYTVSRVEIADVIEVNAADTSWAGLKLNNTGGGPNTSGVVLLGPTQAGSNVITLYPDVAPGSYSPVTGNSTDQDYRFETIPANYTAPFKGLRITAILTHSTGSANIGYRLILGAAQTTTLTPTGASGQIIRIVYEIFYSSATSCMVVTTLSDSGTGTIKHSVDTLSGTNTLNSQTFHLTFNVANTNAVTLQLVYTEIIQ